MRNKLILAGGAIALLFTCAASGLVALLFLYELPEPPAPPVKDAKYYHRQMTQGSVFAMRSAQRELKRDPAKGIPILIEIMVTEENTRGAEDCLIDIGGDAVPELLKLLEKRENVSLRCKTIKVLSWIVANDRARNDDIEIIAKQLAPGLSDESTDVRAETAYGFRNMRKASAAAAALPQLKAAMKDPFPGIRMNSTYAVASVSPDCVEVIQHLKAELNLDDETSVDEALFTIRDHQIYSEDLIDLMIEILKKPNKSNRTTACYAFEALGAKARRAAPALRELAKLDPTNSQDRLLREATVRAIKAVDP